MAASTTPSLSEVPPIWGIGVRRPPSSSGGFRRLPLVDPRGCSAAVRSAPARTDAQGRDVRSAAEPKELPELLAALAPREHMVFFGALDPKELSLAERAMRKLPAAREALPEGDFRDWDDIDSWARAIAGELAGV